MTGSDPIWTMPNPLCDKSATDTVSTADSPASSSPPSGVTTTPGTSATVQRTGPFSAVITTCADISPSLSATTLVSAASTPGATEGDGEDGGATTEGSDDGEAVTIGVDLTAAGRGPRTRGDASVLLRCLAGVRHPGTAERANGAW